MPSSCNSHTASSKRSPTPHAAAAHLRELLAEHDDHARVLQLYDSLAAEQQNPAFSARLWTDAAYYAWSSLRSSSEALSRLRYAFEREPQAPRALAVLAELAEGGEDPLVDQMLCDELDGTALVESNGTLSLRIADAALRLGREAQAKRVYLALVHSHAADELRLSALHTLDGMLERAGLHAERMQVLPLALGHRQDRRSQQCGRRRLRARQAAARCGKL